MEKTWGLGGHFEANLRIKWFARIQGVYDLLP